MRFCHREVRRAFGLSIEGDVLTRESPGEGLFALMPLCQVCHTMIHALGYCPHERQRKPALKDCLAGETI